MATNLNVHRRFREMIWSYIRVRDCYLGSTAVKRKNSLYLPIPTGFIYALEGSQDPASIQRRTQQRDGEYLWPENWRPDYHNNPLYESYLMRARFYDLLSYTLTGIMGIAKKNKPQITLPSTIGYLQDIATRDGKTLEQVYFDSLNENFMMGRVVLLLDVTDDNRLVIVQKTAEQFINWSVDEEKSKIFIDLGVFAEQVKTSDDKGNQKDVVVERRVWLDEQTGYYTTQKFLDGKPMSEPVVPELFGRPLMFIPAVVIGSTNCDVDVDRIPMLQLADISIQAYQKNADLSHAEYLCCSPTLLTLGADEQEVPKVVGAGVSINLSDPSADAKYLEVDGKSIRILMDDIEGLKKEGTSAGVSLIGQLASSAESAEALKLKQGSTQANLMSVVSNTSEGIERLLQYAVLWYGGDIAEVDFCVDLDFAETKMSYNERKQLVDEWNSQLLSTSVVRDNLRRADVIPAEVTDELIEEELSGGSSAVDTARMIEKDEAAGRGSNMDDSSALITEFENVEGEGELDE